MNIRKWTGIVLAVMLLSTVFTAGAATFTPGDYEASAQGFGGTVSVKLTVDEEAITAIEITGEGETPALGGAAIEQMSAAYVGQADAEGVDGMTGATITSDAVKAAVSSALAQARGEAQEAAQIAFTPGTYEGTAAGYNGDVVLNRLAELLAKKYPSATIVKTYETDKSLNAISGTAAESERIAKAVASVKPDLVIASQCD